MRTQSDYRHISQPLSEIKFFKDRNLKESDFLEVIYGFKYQQIPPEKYEIRFGEQGQTFYIILNG